VDAAVLVGAQYAVGNRIEDGLFLPVELGDALFLD